MGRPRTLLPLAVLALAACSANASPTAATPTSLPAAPTCDVPGAPTPLLMLSTCPRHIEVDDTYLYWTSGDGLVRYPKCGSSEGPETINPGLRFLFFIIDDDAVYYLRDDELSRQPKRGGPSTRIATDLGKPGWLVADADAIYVSNRLTCEMGEPCTDDRTLLWRVSKDGRSQEPAVRSGRSSITSLAIDDEHAFFVRDLDWGDYELDRADKVDGTPEPIQLDGGSFVPSGLVADDDSLYLNDETRIVRTSKDGGPSRVVISDPASWISWVWLAGDHLYWKTSNDEGHVQLRRARKDGTEGHTMVEGLDTYALAFDQSALYFGTCDDARGTGAIWMMAR